MDTVHFPGRDVPPYAEYAAAENLVEGGIYFRVGFVDRNLHIPTMEPVVFIGRDLAEGDSGVLYFQDAGSHMAGVRFGSPDQDEAEFHRAGHVPAPGRRWSPPG
jgi:hypothetical protein